MMTCLPMSLLELIIEMLRFLFNFRYNVQGLSLVVMHYTSVLSKTMFRSDS